MKRKSTVLIVDDQEPARQNLEMLLRKENYHLAFASDGAEALAQAKKLVPDLILLDIMMPDMDGFEVCRRLRAHPLLAEVPILMVTALSNRDYRLQGIKAGADDFISKPYDSVELRARVRSITRLNRYRQLLVERVKFRWVVEQAEEGYLIVNENDQMLYANPRARLYLDLPENGLEPTTASFMEWVCQQYNCEPREVWQNWPQQPDGRAIRYLVRPETLTARAFWLRVDVLNLPSGSDMIRTVRLRDVTSQMNTLRDMYGFNTMVTHKLLTPMVHLMGSLDLLARYYRSRVTDSDVAELFETAHEGAGRLDRDIKDIVQYLRALPGLAQAKDAFRLAQLESVVAMVSAELELDAVSVSYPDPGFSDDTRVVLSARAIELILWEILENAKKFHPEHSPTIEISAFCSGTGEVYLQVSDDGLTLSPEHLVQVWTPYYQAEKIFTGEVSGMGLGLTMVATLVWGVGGTCHIRNRVPGPGVVVELTLPLAQDAGSESQQ